MGHFYRLLLLTAVVTTVVYSSVDLKMTSTPTEFVDGFTNDLTITCKAMINGSGSDMVYLTALVISHDNMSLASVSVVSPTGTLIPPTNGTVLGNFDQTGESSIAITITDLDHNDTGTYFCEAVGIDLYNTLERVFGNVTVGSHTPDNSSYLKEIKHIEAKLNGLTTKLEKLGQRWPHVDSDPLFTRITNNNGKTYLLSRSELGHVSMSQFVCFVQGGYLAEVNDVDEFGFLRDELLKELNGTSDVIVWLGTTDAAVEGQWVHQYHPQAPVYKSWSANSGYDCMAMTSRTDFHNEDLDCVDPGRALCELVEDKGGEVN